MQAVVDNNIFEFGDNDAVKVNADPKEVTLTNNTFAHNLWSDVASNNTYVDEKSWKQLQDFGFKKDDGNQLISAGIPVPKEWFDIYLNRTASVPGKVKMDEWNQLREMLGQPVYATGGKAGSGLAPNLPWKEALNAFPKNPKVKAGARAKDLPVVFSGTGGGGGAEAQHNYEQVDWTKGKSKDTWAAFDGKHVTMKIVIKDDDSNYYLSDIKKDDYQCYSIWGENGDKDGGLPMKAYVKRGTKHERVMQKAKSYRTGDPDETYIVKGVARENRTLIVESIERAD